MVLEKLISRTISEYKLVLVTRLHGFEVNVITAYHDHEVFVFGEIVCGLIMSY